MTAAAFFCSALALGLLLVEVASARRRSWVASARQRAERTAGVAAGILVSRLRVGHGDDDAGALCAAISAELRAGAAANQALLTATRNSPLAPRARVAAQIGEPVAPALAADAAATRSTALAGAAACWAAAVDNGAGLADGLDRVAALAWAERRLAADLAAETAAPRATARILGLLPLFGLLLGEILGARPTAWLLGEPAGWLCLGAGAALIGVGHWWSGRIVRGALPDPRGRGR